jgi:hypothetical protein
MDWKSEVKKELTKRIYLYAEGVKNHPHYLTTIGTKADLARTGLVLKEGAVVGFYNEDANDQNEADPLLFEGIVHWDKEKNLWYAILDEASFRHLSDKRE